MQTERKFYVYVHRRKTDGAIFYVGKGGGKTKRLHDTSNRNKLWRAVADECGFSAQIVKSDMPEACSLSLEKALIHSVGRSKLVNMTSGGQGTSGRNATKETIEKLRSASRGKIRSISAREKQGNSLRGRKQSAETIAKRSDKIRGRPLSLDHAEKARNAAVKKPCICVESGVEFPSLEAAAFWLRQNGVPNAGSANPSRACKTGYAAYGFHWKYA